MVGGDAEAVSPEYLRKHGFQRRVTDLLLGSTPAADEVVVGMCGFLISYKVSPLPVSAGSTSPNSTKRWRAR
jgi:hypothetical protein